MRGAWGKAVLRGGLVAAVFALAGCCILDAPPMANFTWTPLEPICFERVYFTDQSTDAGGPMGPGGIVAWSWDFGDSSSSTSQNPSHCYARPGTFRVRLRVTDNCGRSASTEREIRVRPSLQGTWEGYITDLWQRTYMLKLVVSHSSTGGITGMAYVDIFACPFISASLSGDEVRVSFVYPGSGNQWLLVGSYDTARERITGMALNVDWWGKKFGEFELRRTVAPVCPQSYEGCIVSDPSVD